MTTISTKQRMIWAALFEVRPHDRGELPALVWLAGYAADEAEFLSHASEALADEGYDSVDTEDCHPLGRAHRSTSRP